MSKAFYNTISYEGEKLKRENARALKQEELILELFKANPDAKWTPSQVLTIFIRKYNLNPPITSIRRAMTNMTRCDQPKLMKGDLVPGQYHLPEHQWMLSDSNYEKVHTFKKGDPSAAKIASSIAKPKFSQPKLFGDE